MTGSDQRWIFDRCAGHLAIDFANTVSDRHTDAPIERIPTYADLVAFAQQCELVTRREAHQLEDWGRRHPKEAAAIQRGAASLRDALYRVLFAICRGERAAALDLAVVNASMARVRLGETLDWEWSAGPDAPDAFLLAVVRAATELLTSAADRGRVRVCEAPDCVWLYWDTSKNRSRRWCDMKVCGNRMKARRFYERHRDAD